MHFTLLEVVRVTGGVGAGASTGVGADVGADVGAGVGAGDASPTTLARLMPCNPARVRAPSNPDVRPAYQ